MSTAPEGFPRTVTLTCKAVLGVGRRCEHQVTVPARYTPVPGVRPRRYERSVHGQCPGGHPVVEIR